MPRFSMNLRVFLFRRPWRAFAALATAAFLISGCIGLEQKERELTFRPTHAEATWFSGLPVGVQEINLPVGGRPDAPQIPAWGWANKTPPPGGRPPGRESVWGGGGAAAGPGSARGFLFARRALESDGQPQ